MSNPRPDHSDYYRRTRKAATPPSMADKVQHAAGAVVRIARAVVRGEAVFVGEQEKARRLAICRACDAWRERGNLGMGECADPRCGCTKLKQGLATERCPRGKWEPENVPQNVPRVPVS